MSDRPHTVIILGAGASWPYHFPLGADLPRIIEETPANLTHILDESGATQERLDAFRSKVRLVSATLTWRPFPTIDEFLEGAEPEFARATKMALAFALLYREREFSRSRKCRGRDWYNMLTGCLLAATDEQIAGTRVLTFNYERSLQCHIGRSLQLEAERTGRQRWSRLPIVPWHLHGSIGPLQGPSSSWEYIGAEPLTLDCVERAACQIRTFSEDHGRLWEEPLQWICAADRLIFLGFGFHATNLAHLCINDCGPAAPWRRHQQVWASAFEWEDDAMRRVDEMFGFPLRWSKSDCAGALWEFGNPFVY